MSRRRQMSKGKRGELRSRRAELAEIVHQLDQGSTHHTPQTRTRIGHTPLTAYKHARPQPYMVTPELIEKSRGERMDVLQSMAEAAVNATTCESPSP